MHHLARWTHAHWDYLPTPVAQGLNGEVVALAAAPSGAVYVGVFREAIIGFLAAIAKQERVHFSERVKADQAHRSKAPGRPALADDVVAELRRLRGEGLSFKKIQAATGVPRSDHAQITRRSQKLGRF